MLEALEEIQSCRMVNLSLCTDCEASALRLGGLLPSGALTRTRHVEDSEKKDEEKLLPLFGLSLRPVASTRAQTRGLLPSGALDAHPTKDFCTPGSCPGT